MMRLSTLLFQCADALEAGDVLLASRLSPLLIQAREELDSWAEELERHPHPPGLEGFDESLAEAIDGYFEAIDLLELAVSFDVPELSQAIKTQTQDALEIMRDIRDRAESYYDMLVEETISRS